MIYHTDRIHTLNKADEWQTNIEIYFIGTYPTQKFLLATTDSARRVRVRHILNAILHDELGKTCIPQSRELALEIALDLDHWTF
jgi:hypothetical protein